MTNPFCKPCNKESSKVTGKDVYPYREDLQHLNIYLCSCGASVGTHKGTWKPLGSLANKETKRARREAHIAFDKLWKSDVFIERGKAYSWLSNEMNLSEKECHIGMLDLNQCRMVVDVCNNRLNEFYIEKRKK